MNAIRTFHIVPQAAKKPAVVAGSPEHGINAALRLGSAAPGVAAGHCESGQQKEAGAMEGERVT